jgi:DNA-binding response OmpR family regulator
MTVANASSAGVSSAILVVDDDTAVRTLLRDCFELEGYRVSEAKDGASLAERLAQCPVDLITLDLNLGGENGFDIARQVRATNNVPIIMITGKDDPIDRIVGLELGADDYITKPFHVREVLARVRAVLRRYEGHGGQTAGSVAAGSVAAGGAAGGMAGGVTGGATGEADGAGACGHALAFEGWTLDLDRRELRRDDGDRRDLTTAEYNLLAVFVKRPARVLSRDNIMDLLKGHEWSPYDRSIDSLIVRLRKKIEPEPETPRLIKTVRGIGYVFAGTVRRV